MLASYMKNHEKAEEMLALGKAVILAATYSREIYHQMLRELSIKHRAPLYVMLLQVPDEVIETRMQDRIAKGSTSNIVNMESYAEVRDRYRQFEGSELVAINTAGSLNDTLESISAVLPVQ